MEIVKKFQYYKKAAEKKCSVVRSTILTVYECMNVQLTSFGIWNT